MRNLSLFLFAVLYVFACRAQVPETLPPRYIKTIQFRGNSEFSGTPIIKLGQGFTLEFDDLVGNEADYYYKISYYNFDWTPTQLSKIEYLDGFDNVRIREYKNSFNTLQIYTHYKLSIPNRWTKGLKVSGNYMIGIYNEKDELVFSRRFIVYEDIANIGVQIKRSRDLNYINTRQVVNFSISGGDRIIFKNPDRNLNTLVIKNNNLQNSIYNLKPQYHMGTKLIYRYNEESSFNGGNEFLYFDSKDVRGLNLNIRSFSLKKIYNLYLFTDYARVNKAYTYHPDINGHFKVNTIQGDDPSIESEYTWIHFYLKCNKALHGGQLHIYGGFNNFALDESTLMTYNPKTGLYEGKRLFKQGFYNYKYVLVHPDGSIDDAFISGNFDETENQYTVIAYYREPGARYDRVVGVGSANSKNITN